MRRVLFTCAMLSALLLQRVAAQGPGGAYDYPYEDPLVATILGTPTEQQVSLALDIPVRLIDLTVFPEREAPGVFWYNAELRCSLAYQKHKAPLIFVIAGTGAGFNSDKMLFLQSIFYSAGFHVVCISSPTHANFITSASESMTPGILVEDARDLYRVMQKAWVRVRGDIEVSDFYLTGYSLGGTQAAFVSKLDAEQGSFDFRKVLMINPSVNLVSSVTLLDSMLEDTIPGGAAGAGEFLREMLDKFAQIYATGDFVKLDHEFLYNIYRSLPAPPKDANLKGLIGISFRLSSCNMIFAADVMTQHGFVVPKGLELRTDDPLGEYLRTLTFISFTMYLDDFLLPAARMRDPQVTREMVVEGSGLRSIESYLEQADRVGVVTNADDIILAPGDLEYLRQLFGDRATIFPRGGHCGNIQERQMAAAMTDWIAKP